MIPHKDKIPYNGILPIITVTDEGLLYPAFLQRDEENYILVHVKQLAIALNKYRHFVVRVWDHKDIYQLFQESRMVLIQDKETGVLEPYVEELAPQFNVYKSDPWDNANITEKTTSFWDRLKEKLS